jgi:hypothetical protein
MATITMDKAPGATVQSRPTAQATSLVDLNAVYPDVGLSISQVRQEIDDAFDDIKTFHTREPDEVFRLVSGHSGRLAELRGRAQRVEDRAAIWKQLRTREIEPALDELNKQFQIASRLLAVRDLDFRMEGGK